MKKRWTLLIFVVLATLIAATPALAAGPGNQNRQENEHRYQVGQPLPSNQQVFTLTGTITAIGTDSITVLVHNGNRLIKPYIGQELVVQVTENTRYRQWTPDGCVPITFEDLEVGDATSIQGTVSEEVFTAARVTVDVPCCTP
jgi:hypothetical protein